MALTQDDLVTRGQRALEGCRADGKKFTPQQLAKRAGGGNYQPIGRYWSSWEEFADECGARSEEVDAGSGILGVDHSNRYSGMIRRAQIRSRTKYPAAERQDPDFRRGTREVRRLEGARNYVVTCAMNNTLPEVDFLATLKVYAAERDAELLVIPVRYKNPTSRRDPQEDREDYWWHEDFAPYLVENELRIHPLLRVMGNVRIAATAGNPLPSRRDSRTKAESAIYGHPQLQMHTVATPQQALPKILYSTGAATQKNYSRTDAGDSADFHHSHAAIVVETRGDRFHMREVNWGGEDFYDLDRRYTPEGSEPSPGVRALIMGDTHVRQMDSGVREATFGSGGIVSVLDPECVVQHDVLDGMSINPHERGKKLTEAIRAMRGDDDVEEELIELADYLVDTDALHQGQTVIVSSNHDDFLTRWLQGSERWVLPRNRLLHAWLTWACLRYALEHDGEEANPLELWFREHAHADGSSIRFLGLDESFRVEDVELGMHGHLGSNGSRGSAKSLSKVGTRSVIGHSHSPEIYQGCYQVGTSSVLRLSYNKGPSSWLHAHAVIHPNGKRQMIAVIDGHWRGED